MQLPFGFSMEGEYERGFELGTEQTKKKRV